MSRSLSARGLVQVVALIFAWCALWGEVSVANLGSGLALALVLSRLAGGDVGSGRIRWRPLARLTGLVLVDLVVSTASVAREVVTRGDSTEEAIIAVELPEGAGDRLLLLVVAITLTPGTAVVDTDRTQGILYLHLLHADRAAAVRAHLTELSGLACRALSSPANTEEPSL